MPKPRLDETIDDRSLRIVTYLTPEDSEITKALHDRLGLRTRADLVRMALRSLYREQFGRSWGETPEAGKSSSAA